MSKLVKPTDETATLVHEWLADNGIETERLVYSSSRDWISVPLPIDQIETLLDTEYSIYRHEDGSEIVRAPKWSLPRHLHDHIVSA